MAPPMNARLRAENQRVDELVRGVEAGSPEHIRNINDAWPKEASNIKRIISSLLKQLDVSKIPRFAFKQTIIREGTDPFNQAAIIRECLCVLAGSDIFDDLNDNERIEVVVLFCSRLTDILAAVEFFAVYSPLLVKERPGLTDAVQFGNLVGASIITRIFHYGRPILQAEEGHPSFELMVEYVLRSWVRWIHKWPLPYDTKLTPKEYFFYEPIYMMLVCCFDDGVVSKIMQEKVESSGQKTLRRLVHSFTYRSVEWATIHKPKGEKEAKQLTTTNLGNMAEIVEMFGLSRRFHVAVLKNDTLPIFLTLGWDFRCTPSNRSCGGSIATHIASEVFPQWHWPAWALVRIVPKLLKAGLLKFIVEDCLIEGIDQPKRWHDRDPLQDLFRIAHHPKIFDPLYTALKEIHLSPFYKKRLAKTIEDAADKSLAVGTRMLMIGACLKVYEESHLRSSVTDGYYAHCESLDHYRNSGHAGYQTPRECSQCQSVVYCSKKCQEADWEMLHHDVCLFLRHVRIERELHGLWLSHKDRMRYLQFLEFAYLDALLSDELTAVEHRHSQDRTDVTIYCVNTVIMPIAFEVFSPKKLFSLEKGGERMFFGERFRDVVRRGKELSVNNDSIRILASVSGIGGDHWVTALGVYHQLRQQIKKDGFPCFRLLASHVMVKSCGRPDQGISEFYTKAIADYRANPY